MGNAWKSLVLGTLIASMTACSGGGGGGSGGGSSTSSDLTISGKVGSVGTLSVSENASDGVGKFGTYDNIKLYITVYNDPPQISSTSVNSDGSFSLTVPNASGTVIGAQFKNTLTNVVKFVYFQDTSKKGMDSSDLLMESYPLKGSVNFGTLDLSGGKATIDVVSVIPAANRGAAGGDVEGYDFSGAWSMAAYSLPQALKDEGFITAETNTGGSGQSCGDEPCLTIGQTVSLVKIAGKEFTAGASCTEGSCPSTAGTVGTANKYGISIWDGPISGTGSGLQACGYKTGFTADSARFGAGIHIPSASIGSQALTLADFTFTSLGGTEPWMKASSQSKYTINDCGSMTKTVSGTTYNLYVCRALVWANPDFSGDKTVYNVNEQSSENGCVEDGTNKPVNVTDWANITPDSSCTETTIFPGMKRTSCHYTSTDPDGSGSATATSFTCKGSYGTFADTNLDTPAVQGTDYYTNATRNGSAVVLLAANQPCSGLDLNGTDAQKLAAYQCYAQDYESSRSGCYRDYRFNWSAKTPADFVMTDKHPRPKSNFLTDIVTFSSDGNTFFVNKNENETVAIAAGKNGSLEFCDISRSIKMVGKKMSDSQQLITLVQSGILLSADKGACVAAVNGEDNWDNGNLPHKVGKAQKFMFLLNK